MPRRRGTARAIRPATALPVTTVRVTIYTRRSTDEENQPFTIEAQTAKLKSYIKSQDGWTLVEEYSDDASGAKLERLNLNRALFAARAGLFERKHKKQQKRPGRKLDRDAKAQLARYSLA